MALPFYNWSRTAASNATADSTVNWAEGQAPSTVNDSARAMMASTAAYRDDIAGAIVTGGTSTAYTVTSYEVFDTLAHLNGQMIAFTPHATNGATVTLNVDGLGAKPLRPSPGVELTAGVLVLGTPYTCVYNNSDAVFYLQNFYANNPYNIPIAGGMDYFASTAPNSAFVFPVGQAISRTTYATLFALISTTYGVGNGSTTFNVPDKRGRVSAGLDNMGGSASSRLTNSYFTPDNATLGGSGGATQQTFVQNMLPNATLSHTGTVSVTSSASNVITGTLTTTQSGPSAFQGVLVNGTGASGAITSTGTESGSTSSINGGVTQQPYPTLQPTILCNYIMRII